MRREMLDCKPRLQLLANSVPLGPGQESPTGSRIDIVGPSLAVLGSLRGPDAKLSNDPSSSSVSLMRLEWQIRLASCLHRYRSPAPALDQP